MEIQELFSLMEKKISPFGLTDEDKTQLAGLFYKFPEPLLMECIEIGIHQYFHYDSDGQPTEESIDTFMRKLGGIVYNRSRTPIEQEIRKIKNYCKRNFSYWNERIGTVLLYDYVNALRSANYDDDQIIHDFQTEVKRLTFVARNWSQWEEMITGWIDEIKTWQDSESEDVSHNGSVLPSILFANAPIYIQRIAQQINGSYENNLFDCCTVMMRRMLEVLLILSYQYQQIEDQIIDNDSHGYYSLREMIEVAAQNQVLALSLTTRQDMHLFKDLGDFSAHKIVYHCTRQDILPHIMKYRAIIEELLVKSGIG